MTQLHGRSYYWVLDGHDPVAVDDVRKWGEWFETADRRVGFTEIGEGVEVSTVFLALDHNFWDHGPAILFETMVFMAGTFTIKIGDYERTFHREEVGDFTRRYATWDEAATGHDMTVSLVKQMYEAQTAKAMQEALQPDDGSET